MAHERDYENIHDIDQLDDRELRDLVREQLAAHTALDIDDITVIAAQGNVTLSGRVGTEGEKRVAEHVLNDVLGIMEFTNDLVIDTLRRGESPVDIHDHLADEDARAGTLLGDAPVPLSDEANHLADRVHEDLDGTADYQQVMEDGRTWNPPDSPTPEGISGSDARPEDMGGQH
ncbi:MAG TPA: BON domain-containing protein [Gemmatimonadaceae bacterium]|nr:BON domain-containing protein [Gemmatimonadaceae bacterium]